MKNLIVTFAMLFVSICTFAQVDIAVSDVSVTPSAGYKGSSFFVRVDAANVGTVDLTDYIIDFYVSKSSTFDEYNSTYVGTTYGYSLRVGDKVNHSFSFVFPTYISNTSTSTWYVWAKVTNRGIIEPTDKEDNNTASGTVTIYGSSY